MLLVCRDQIKYLVSCILYIITIGHIEIALEMNFQSSCDRVIICMRLVEKRKEVEGRGWEGVRKGRRKKRERERERERKGRERGREREKGRERERYR